MAGQRAGKFRTSLPVAPQYNPIQALTPVPEGKVVLAAKSGTLQNPTVSHDAGILLLPKGPSAVLVMMTATKSNPETEKIMGQVARTLYEALR